MHNNRGSSGVSVIDVAIFIDGSAVTNGGYKRVTATNSSGIGQRIENYSMGINTTLSAASHTFEIKAKYFGGSTAYVSGDNTTVLQGTLRVTILKQ